MSKSIANEEKKDFTPMLHGNDDAGTKKYGGHRMYFAPPIDYDATMKKVPYGKVITVGKIREYFAKIAGADFRATLRPVGVISCRFIVF